jgi:biotin carboxyl carrier protein
MKIQQQIKSNCDGVVGVVAAHVGVQVKKRQVLLQVTAD